MRRGCGNEETVGAGSAREFVQYMTGRLLQVCFSRQIFHCCFNVASSAFMAMMEMYIFLRHKNPFWKRTDRGRVTTTETTAPNLTALGWGTPAPNKNSARGAKQKLYGRGVDVDVEEAVESKRR